MSTALGFGAITEDDEFLDRMGARRRGTGDELEDILSAWTAQIDADERACAREVGPLGLRGVDATGGADPRPVRVVRVPRTRVVGVLGAIALTMSGGGVAAALGQVDIAPVRNAIVRAAGPALAAEAPTVTQTPMGVSPTDGTAAALLAKARTAADTGETQRAMGLLEAIRLFATQDAMGAQITAEVDRLERRIVASDPSLVSPSTTDRLVAVPTGEGAVLPRPTTASSSAAGASAPTVTSTPSATAGRPSEPTLEKSTGGTTRPDAATRPVESPRPTDPTRTPDEPATTAPTPTPPPGVGVVGGEQNPGTASPSGRPTAPAEGGSTPTPTETETSPVQRPTVEEEAPEEDTGEVVSGSSDEHPSDGDESVPEARAGR